jgi:hypothetical protein
MRRRTVRGETFKTSAVSSGQTMLIQQRSQFLGI